MYEYEKKLWKQYEYIAGTDESGRGPIAGPVVAAAVIFPKNYQNNLINDSKKLTEKNRNKRYEEIINDAITYSITIFDSKEVDFLNPKKAAKKAMETSIKRLKIKPEYLLVDYEVLNLNIQQSNIIRGDEKSISIAAASILAKVTRDKIMVELSKKHPKYSFEKHKGYFTKVHKEAIKKYGVLDIHRKSYKPIKEFLLKK